MQIQQNTSSLDIIVDGTPFAMRESSTISKLTVFCFISLVFYSTLLILCYHHILDKNGTHLALLLSLIQFR